LQIFASKVEARPSRVAESEEREEFDDDSVRKGQAAEACPPLSSGVASWLLWLNPQDCHRGSVSEARPSGRAGWGALAYARASDTNRWRATTIALMFYGAKSFSSFEGQSYALRLAFFVVGVRRQA